MKKTYQASCHCGKVKLEAEFDLADGTGRCNCTFCTKTRWWGTIVKPEAFRLLSGENDLGDYLFNTCQGHHQFCKHCGVRPFATGDVAEIGGKYVSINLACLDNVDLEELGNAPIQYMDGRNNNWWNVPAQTKHL